MFSDVKNWFKCTKVCLQCNGHGFLNTSTVLTINKIGEYGKTE